jgi:hypothetical protein
MEPIVDGLEETYGHEFKIVRINIDRSDGVKLAREHGIIGQPSYIFFDRGGEEIRRMAGSQFPEVMAQEIERILGE